MTKKQLALEIIRRLKEAYPDAGCTLDYDEAWKLLVSVRLAAQCTDARVNVIVEKLYEKFPDVDALAAADVSEIEEIVRPCGLGKSKAKELNDPPKMVHRSTIFSLFTNWILFLGSTIRSRIIAPSSVSLDNLP